MTTRGRGKLDGNVSNGRLVGTITVHGGVRRHFARTSEAGKSLRSPVETIIHAAQQLKGVNSTMIRRLYEMN